MKTDTLQAPVAKDPVVEEQVPLTPISIVVTRYVCPYCHRSRSRRKPCQDHMERCWKNPALRGCKTCVNFVGNRCRVGFNLAPGLVTGCSKWKPKEEV